MRSPHSTIPAVTIARTPDGYRATCDGCDFDEVRLYRATADVCAIRHVQGHGTPMGEQD